MSTPNVEDMLASLQIAGIMILGRSGERIVSKYYKKAKPTTQAQLDFERALHNKVSPLPVTYEPDVFMFEEYVVIYRLFEDVRIFVLLTEDENEIIGLTVFNAFVDSLNVLFDNRISKAAINNNLDMVMLLLDELCDDGMIVETDPEALLQRVSMRDTAPSTPIQDQTLASAMLTVRDQFFRSLRG